MFREDGAANRKVIGELRDEFAKQRQNDAQTRRDMNHLLEQTQKSNAAALEASTAAQKALVEVIRLGKELKPCGGN